MGAYLNYESRIHIAKKTSQNGALECLGYADINSAMMKKIVDNSKLKYIQISGHLPGRAYRIIDKILSLRPDITFRLFWFTGEDKIDLSFLLKMPNVHRLQIDCIHLRDRQDKINLDILTKLKLKTLGLECFDLRDYSFMANLSEELEGLSVMADTMGPGVNFDCAWLKRYSNLKTVFLGKKAKKNLECLAEIPSIRTLVLRGIKITDFSFLKQMNLDKLALWWNSNNDLHELSELTNLKEIDLWRINKLSDISFIKDLKNLEVIKLQDLKHVTSLPDLSAHAKLKKLILDDTGIDINGLPDYLKIKASNWDNR